MNWADIPRRLVRAFADAGGRTDIPAGSQGGVTPGAASLEDGFPLSTRTPLAAGGVPPSGLDMNGVLYLATAWCRWSAAGSPVRYSTTFSQAVGGYPAGAILAGANVHQFWLNLIDGNNSDPDAAGSHDWVVVDPQNILDRLNGLQAEFEALNANLTGFANATAYLSRQIIQGSSAGGISAFSNVIVPAAARRVLIEASAGGGSGGSGNTGGGGGGAGGAGTRGFLAVTAGQIISGHVGNGGYTTANGFGGGGAGDTEIVLNDGEIIHLLPGGSGALGGSAVVPGNTQFGTVASSPAGFFNSSGQSGGNGLITSSLFIGGGGGGSIFGGGGLTIFTPNTAGAASPGNGATYPGASGSGATGGGIGAAGAGGIVILTFFG